MKKSKNNLEVNIAQVFVNRHGEFGNPVGIVKDEDCQIDDKERQKIATKLNFSETVFIDSIDATANVSIFNPQQKVKFAGHAVLGAAYFINHVLGQHINSIKCGDETVIIKFEGDTIYISAPLSIMPSWNFEHLGSANKIEELPEGKISQLKHTFVWAWVDEFQGLVRARTFCPGLGNSGRSSKWVRINVVGI